MAAANASCDDLDAFTCSICKDVYKNPVKISCGHTFCEVCIDKTWKSKKNECPFCRAKVEIGEKEMDMEMMTKMSSKSTTCRRCKKFLVLTEYRRHERICGGGLTSSWTSGGTSFEKDVKPNIYTFICPYCQYKNLDREGLVAHVKELHRGDNTQVVCPICKAMPWGNVDQRSQNFQDHIKLRHRFDYDRFVDLNQDEETALKNTLVLSTESH